MDDGEKTRTFDDWAPAIKAITAPYTEITPFSDQRFDEDLEIDIFLDSLADLFRSLGYKVPAADSGFKGLSLSSEQLNDEGFMLQLISLYEHFVNKQAETHDSLSFMRHLLPYQPTVLSGHDTVMPDFYDETRTPYTLNKWIRDFGEILIHNEIPFFRDLEKSDRDNFDVIGLADKLGLERVQTPKYDQMKMRIGAIVQQVRGTGRD